MHIQINLELPLSDDDKAFLRGLIGDEPPAPAAKPAPEVMKEDAEKAQKPTKKAAKAKAEPTPEPEPDEDAASVLATAQERATEIVQSGDIPRVKKALAAVGVKKVSLLTEDNAAEFLEALED